MAEEEIWQDALAIYEGLTMGRRKVEITSIVRPILECLQHQATSLAELRAIYQAGDDWWLEIAREGYPDQPRLWEKHRTADVAFGIRYRQLTEDNAGRS